MELLNLKPCVQTGSQKIKYIFDQGYLPSRGLSFYDDKVLKITNCFGHAALNLLDNFLTKFTLDEKSVFSLTNFGDTRMNELEYTFLKTLNYFNLSVSLCEKDDEPDELSWKVALYFDNWEHRDFHFYKYEKKTCWSHKNGYNDNIYIEKTPPLKTNGYELYDYYMITNNHGKQLSEKELKSIELEISQMN